MSASPPILMSVAASDPIGADGLQSTVMTLAPLGWHPMPVRSAVAVRAHDNTPQVVNALFGAEGMVRPDAWQRLVGSFQGAGARLSGASAAGLARGGDMWESAKAGRDFAWQGAAGASHPGTAKLLPDRFF